MIKEKIEAIIIVGLIVGVIISTVIAMIVGIIWTTSVIVDADEFYCDWIFCSFRKTIKEAECYQNGEPINCSMIVPPGALKDINLPINTIS